MLAGAYETDTIKTSIMAFLVVFEKTECRHRPEQHKSGGFPPTPPRLFFFFACGARSWRSWTKPTKTTTMTTKMTNFGSRRGETTAIWVDDEIRISGEVRRSRFWGDVKFWISGR